MGPLKSHVIVIFSNFGRFLKLFYVKNKQTTIYLLKKENFNFCEERYNFTLKKSIIWEKAAILCLFSCGSDVNIQVEMAATPENKDFKTEYIFNSHL